MCALYSSVFKPECVLVQFLVCVCVWSCHTWAPPNSVVAALVDTATWQSAFSSRRLMTCWDFCWWKWDHLHRWDLLLCLQWQAYWKYTGRGLYCYEHTCKWKSPQDAQFKLNASVYVHVYSTVCCCMHVETLHELPVYSEVIVRLRVHINLFMNRATESTCKCVWPYIAYILCVSTSLLNWQLPSLNVVSWNKTLDLFHREPYTLLPVFSPPCSKQLTNVYILVVKILFPTAGL